MTPPEIQQALKTLKILVDTREQDTPAFRRRVAAFGCPFERRALKFGDYSAAVMIDGAEHVLASRFAIERKMNLDELAGNYTRGRKRFEREFERAKAQGARVYLLVEHGEFEKMFAGSYRSQLNPAALVASVFAWMPRYGCTYLPCKPDTTPLIIREICYREAKEYLEGLHEITERGADQGSA